MYGNERKCGSALLLLLLLTKRWKEREKRLLCPRSCTTVTGIPAPAKLDHFPSKSDRLRLQNCRLTLARRSNHNTRRHSRHFCQSALH